MLTDKIKNYFEDVRIPIRLTCVTESGWPMVLSLWFVYKDNKLYCATKANAKVVGYIENNQKCAFEIASDLPPYCGVRGYAKAKINEDKGEETLRALINRYLGSEESTLAKTLLSQVDQEVAIELSPVKIFSWNFSKRMKDALPEIKPKPCP